MHLLFSAWKKKIKRKFTETQGNSSKVQTQLLSNFNAAKCWVTQVLPFSLLPEYMRKTYIKGFLSFLTGWHPLHSSSNLHEFSLNHVLWASVAGEDQTHPSGLWVMHRHKSERGEVFPTSTGKSFLSTLHRLPLNPAKLCQHMPLVWINDSTKSFYHCQEMCHQWMTPSSNIFRMWVSPSWWQ